jgi:hypothetical protein
MEKSIAETIKSLEKIAAYAENLKELAVLAGAKANNLSYHNAMLACEKALNEFINYKKEAEELGTSLANVLKSYKMSHKSSDPVPSEMRYAPPHWISEASVETVKVWKNSKLIDKVYKTREVTAATAQRLRAGLQPQVLSLFTLLEEQNWEEADKDLYRNQVIEAYMTESYREFSEKLIDALWRLNVGEEDISRAEDSKRELGTLPCDSPEFETCVEFATVYSKPVRDHLVEWAKENGIRIHRELLVDWAAEYPDRLFSELMRKRFQRDKPISDWILLALTESELASGDSLGWSDQVSFEMLERMIKESIRIEEDPKEGFHHQGVIDSLAETSLQIISQGKFSDQVSNLDYRCQKPEVCH